MNLQKKISLIHWGCASWGGGGADKYCFFFTFIFLGQDQCLEFFSYFSGPGALGGINDTNFNFYLHEEKKKIYMNFCYKKGWGLV